MILRKIIMMHKLKKKLSALNYNKAEVRSTVDQIKKFDKDLRLAIYYWLEEDLVPGDSDPALVIENQYTVSSLCDDFGMTVPGALILIQTYRRDKEAAFDAIQHMSARAPVSISDKELEELYEKFGITDDEPEASNEDIPVNETKEDKS